jgi:hypothetical protein
MTIEQMVIDLETRGPGTEFPIPNWREAVRGLSAQLGEMIWERNSQYGEYPTSLHNLKVRVDGLVC